MLAAVSRSLSVPAWGLSFQSRRTDISAITAEINKRAEQLTACSDAEIRRMSERLIEHNGSPQAKAARNQTHDRPTSKQASSDFQSVAIVCEAVRRSLGLSMYDCQLAAAWITASGKMIEMQTGEGKTLVCGAAAAVEVLSGSTAHVATTNAYLAGRDYAAMRPLFDFLGITCATLPQEHSPKQTKAAYLQQIVYGPGYQFGFDYLFDQITRQKYDLGALGAETLCSIQGLDVNRDLVQTGRFETTIIDEADSVLIDEALTPLILSVGTDDKLDPLPFKVANRFVEQLQESLHFRLDRRQSLITLTSIGLEKSNAYRSSLTSIRLQRTWSTYVSNALRARHLLDCNKDYVVADGKVKIVDPLTGRIFEDRNWQSGLHQAVEAKEGVEITAPRQSQVRTTRQTFIRKYNRIAGMSGTIEDTANELKQTYGVAVVAIPTHRPCRRSVLPNRFFANWEAKAAAIAVDVRMRHDQGQPILIGTTSIKKSLLLAQVLESAGLPPVVLNGLQDKAEAEIVAQAGQLGQITIATNMAGRGTDIKLSQESLQRGGLHVIGTEPNPCRRVDRQLVGRAARQGEIGSAQFFISADDDLILKRGPRVAHSIIRACNRNHETQTNFSNAIIQLQLQEERAQAEARRLMVSNERWLDKARDTVFGK